METNSISQASKVEIESAKRIKDAHQRVEDEEKGSTQAIDEIRDKFQHQYITENLRQEASMEAQRLKGYEELRDLNRNQQGELRRMRSQGETDLDRLRAYYKNQMQKEHFDETEKLNAMRSQTHRILESERKTGEMQEWEIRDKNNERLQELRRTGENTASSISTTNQNELKQIRENYQAEKERVIGLMEQSYAHTAQSSADLLKTFKEFTDSEIQKTRQENASQLARYASKQQDPFYKMMDMNAKLEDFGDKYVLTATVPKYEQEHLFATIKGNNIVISGRRRNEERQDLGNGHFQSSSSYQSYQESFPLTWPVEAALLSKSFDGDTVIVSVPKKNEFAQTLPKHKA